jgi:hypothetical protein
MRNTFFVLPTLFCQLDSSEKMASTAASAKSRRNNSDAFDPLADQDFQSPAAREPKPLAQS